MLCPKCGKEYQIGENYCLACGTKLDNVVPENQQFIPDPLQAYQNNNVQNPVPMPSYAGDTGIISMPKEKRPFPKFLVIGIVALVVAVLGVVSFFLIKAKIDRDYIVSHPTEYVADSVEAYFDNSQTSSELKSIIKNTKDKATLKIDVNAEGLPGIQQQDAGLSYLMSFDKSNKQVYYKLDAGKLVPMLLTNSGGLFQGGNAMCEVYSDPKRMDFAYDVMGSSGKYFIEPGKFREQAQNSIFSPSKDNVLNISSEQFEKFIEGFETFYRAVTDDSNSASSAEGLKDKIVKKFEEDGNVTFESGSTNVLGDDVKTDIITYTYGHTEIKKLLGDIRDEMIIYARSNSSMLGNSADVEKGITDSFNSAISGFDSGVNKNIKATIRVYVEPKKKELVKFEIIVENYMTPNPYNTSVAEPIVISGEFAHKPYMNIVLKASVGNDYVAAKLDKEVSGDVTRYIFEGSASNSTQKVTASFEYNKAAKTFTLNLNGYIISGMMDITGNSIKLGYDFDLTKMGAPSGVVKLNVELSSDAQINMINADKNLFSLTVDEFKGIFGMTGSQRYQGKLAADMYNTN